MRIIGTFILFFQVKITENIDITVMIKVIDQLSLYRIAKRVSHIDVKKIAGGGRKAL